MTTIRIDDVSVSLDRELILREVNLVVPSGTATAVVGPNGAGKTTLLKAAAGLLPHGGTVTVGESATTPRSRARLVAYVPQRPERPAGMTVLDYIALGRTPHLGFFSRQSPRDLAAVNEAIAVMDLGALVGRDVATLSGGEAQRVALARAVAQEAGALVLDEPTTGLDIGRQQEVMAMITGLRRARGLTVLATTHDLTLASQFADQVALLSGGALVHQGPAVDVLTPELISTHYGADVAVVTDDDGHTHIVPRRAMAHPRSEETQT